MHSGDSVAILGRSGSGKSTPLGLIGLLTAAPAIGAGVPGLRVALSVFGSRFPSLEGVALPWQAGGPGWWRVWWPASSAA